MEWTMPINDMLHQQISKLNSTLIPKGFSGDVRTIRTMQESLSKVINAMGVDSAAAQGLNKVITSAEKLRNCPEHVLYLLKDPEAKGGAGEVVGLLKVGHKHLFLYDERNQVRELEPLCVLDFYVRTDRQRQGLGRQLFDAMLQDTGATVTELAIDGPSNNMEQFLQRNYGIERLVRQNNNFAVAPQFFSYKSTISTPGRTTPGSTPLLGRFAAPKPPSAIATVIHGGGGYHESNNGEKVVSAATTPTPVTPKPLLEPEPEHEVVEKLPERPSTLHVEVVDAGAGARSPRRESQLTDRGYFDIKYYHNKLW